MSRPTVLFHCQASIGLGHVVRAFSVAGALAERFDVVLLTGARLPRGVPVPPGVRIVSLPPMGTTAGGGLVSLDRRRSVERALELRRAAILALQDEIRPDVVLVAPFPFGQEEFGDELMALLDAARAAGALTLCSVRDILGGPRPDQERYDARASVTANEMLDAVLVHADSAFARLDDSFRPATPLRVPVYHTGFVLPRGDDLAALAPFPRPRERPRVVVSAGGGRHGGDLMRAAVEAHRLKLADAGIDVRLVAGPFLPDAEWRALRDAARGRPGLDVRRTVPDMRAELGTAAASVSHAGYSTVLDVVYAGVPALLVPCGSGPDSEQARRANRLNRMGALRVLDPARLDGATLAAEIQAVLSFHPEPAELALDGARKTALIVGNLLARASAPAPGGERTLHAVRS
jgi:predicted glycosyltransferase